MYPCSERIESESCLTYPEPRRHVTNVCGIAAAVGDEEGDDPARDGDFGALVGEDEEGAHDRDAVLQRLPHQLCFSGLAGLICGLSARSAF